MKRIGLVLGLMILFLMACFQTRVYAQAEEDLELEFEEEVKEMWDPLEGYNRLMFKFNDKVYVYVLEPTAKAFRKVVPKVVRKGIGNLFNALGTPKRILANLLQMKFKRAGKELCKFGINMLTLETWDISKKFVRIEDAEDFDQTLGVWGIPQGPYIVLPFIGPSSPRGMIGLAGDGAGYPPVYFLRAYELAGIGASEVINDTSLDPTQYKNLKAGALDLYIAVREGYKDNCIYRIKK